LLELALCVVVVWAVISIQTSPGRSTIPPIVLAAIPLFLYCVSRERVLRGAPSLADLARTTARRVVHWRPDRFVIAGIALSTFCVLALVLVLGAWP